ncbi:Brain-specific angiogenesis inhibitor 1-like [Oopsacas minuta]|uniref:Brain-specific angiogenesis inhibitor 1-like n=1 Tax=Oopsacas minuta TaxID=111878 RepID=A0AAV7KQ80_9METZ|nr:Brain-specific angiogenesis inhibitor 1-like [Oopsacas minuta]
MSSANSYGKGIWHPSGYYGAYMSKTRLDFDNKFRKSVRPIPPSQFENRYTTHSSKHPFSAHDNRHTFQNHGSYFGKDTFIGKRKITGRSYSAQKGILNWKHEHNSNNNNVFQGAEYLPHLSIRDPLFIHKDNDIFPSSKLALKSAYQDAFCMDAYLHRIYQPPNEYDIEPIMKSTYKKAYNGSRHNSPWTSRHSTH